MLLPQSVFIPPPPFAETEAVLVRSSLEHKPCIAEADGVHGPVRSWLYHRFLQPSSVWLVSENNTWSCGLIFLSIIR